MNRHRRRRAQKLQRMGLDPNDELNQGAMGGIESLVRDGFMEEMENGVLRLTEKGMARVDAEEKEMRENVGDDGFEEMRDKAQAFVRSHSN